MAVDMMRKMGGVAMVAATLLLSACTNFSEHAPQSAHRPWTPPPASAQWQQLAMEGAPAATTSTALAPLASVDLAHTYELPELVNMAQLNNPITRVAWSQARQAASAIGMTEAAYLPMLSANVIGGRAAIRHRFPEVLDERVRVKSSVSGYAGLLGFEWLLFDFGGRESASEAARNLSLVANFTFNAIHQQLAFDVTSAYYAYGAARHHSEIAVEALSNSRKLQDAALARSKSGLATSVEVAQARQLVAQARLQQATAQGAQRNAYQVLLGHLGVPFDTPLKVADSANVPLPSHETLPEGAILRRALADRPDILASIASLKAAENAVDVARASFAPKVFLAGFTAGGNNDLSIGPIGGLSNSGASRAIFLGMSLPIFDGGIRSTRVYDARERVSAAQASLDKLRSAALSEMVVASNLLENALASHDAASELVDTAAFTYQAALETYQEGLGTITVATEASTLLLTARGAQADAHAAALTAAAALALSLGQLDIGDARSTIP